MAYGWKALIVLHVLALGDCQILDDEFYTAILLTAVKRQLLIVLGAANTV